MNKIIEFYNEHNKIKWVFFDMFDTVVHRKCQPEHIKKLWSKKIIYEFAIKLLPEQLYRIRRESEEYLRYNGNKEHDYEFDYEELCLEIYKRLSFSKLINSDSKTISFSNFYEFSLNAESTIELDNQYIDDESIEAIKYFKKRKVSIAIISDFYHDSTFIINCLKNIKIDLFIDKIFVSCEYKASKSSGTLYHIALEQINVDPCNVIMIGDNNNADIINSKKYEIQAYLKELHYNFKDIDISKEIGLMRKLSKDRKYSNYPYSNYAFSIFLFADRLYRRIKKENLKNIFFLSREGEELKKYFDYYCDFVHDKSIKTYYLYVSRVATFLPSLSNLDKEDFNTLFREFNNLSTVSFLKNFNISDKVIDNICIQTGIDSNLVINNFKNSYELKKILNNEIFIDYYETNRLKQRNNFKEYLDSFNIDYEKEGMNIVDIGWKGTIQDNLYKFFQGKVHINGFYLGLNNSGNLLNENQKYGLVFSIYPYKSDYYKIYSFDFTFYERLFFASHGSVQSYERGEDKSIHPETILYDKEKGKKELIAPIQKNIFEKYKKICEYIISSEFVTEELEDVFAEEHINAIFNTKKSNFTLQDTLFNSHIQNFGYFKYANNVATGKKVRNIKNIRNIAFALFKDKKVLLNRIYNVNKRCAKHGLYIINNISTKLLEINIIKFK